MKYVTPDTINSIYKSKELVVYYLLTSAEFGAFCGIPAEYYLNGENTIPSKEFVQYVNRKVFVDKAVNLSHLADFAQLAMEDSKKEYIKEFSLYLVWHLKFRGIGVNWLRAFLEKYPNLKENFKASVVNEDPARFKNFF